MKINKLLEKNLVSNSEFKLYNLIIKSSLKNSSFFLYYKNCFLIKQWSIRSKNYKKLERKYNTQYNVNRMIIDLVNFLEHEKIFFLNIIFLGIGLAREEFEKNFDYDGLVIVNIFDHTKIPFNGCRLKKKKRL